MLFRIIPQHCSANSGNFASLWYNVCYLDSAFHDVVGFSLLFHICGILSRLFEMPCNGKPWSPSYGRRYRSYVVLQSPNRTWALLKDGCGCKQGDVMAPPLFDDTHTAKLQQWHEAGNTLSSELHVPALVVEDSHFDVLVPQALTVLADDTARAGIFLSTRDFTQQIETWSTSLDDCLRQLNLFRNKGKQFLVVSCVSPEKQIEF